MQNVLKKYQQIRLNKKHLDTLANMAFSLESCAHAKLGSRWLCPELRAPFNRLYLVRSGSALLKSGGKEYEMKPGMAYLLPAGLSCGYTCPDEWEKVYFHFNYLCPDGYDIFWGSEAFGCLPIPEGLLESLVQCLDENSFLDALTLRQSVLQMVTAFVKEAGMGRTLVPNYSEIVQDTILYIRDHLSARLHIDQLAQRCFVSKTHLTETFRKETGITLGRYIDEQLMLEAQRRLCHTKDTISNISRDLGFSDQFYFSRRFVQLCGMTPRLYRSNTHL